MANQRDNPRISLNQLALYLSASAVRRRSILRDQKNPKTFRVAWYEQAQSAISSFILGGCKDEDLILQEIDGLQGAEATSDYEGSRNRTNAQALECFIDSYDKLDLDGLEIMAGSHDSQKIDVGGVNLSVRPELLLKSISHSPLYIGAIKLYLSKDHRLDDESGRYISTVLAHFVSECIATANDTVEKRRCLVFDIFGGEVYQAPKATKRRFNEIESACEEIALLWPHV